jgi:hypothetical protein
MKSQIAQGSGYQFTVPVLRNENVKSTIAMRIKQRKKFLMPENYNAVSVPPGLVKRRYINQ